jgi:dephospho-CoA kinase
MGKSTVAQMFRDFGVPVFDADATVRAMQGPGGALLSAIEAAFPGTTGADGVDRGTLGAAVFGNPEALARLEAIVHPAVGDARKQFLAEHHDSAMVVFDIPLLFERTGRAGMDAVVVVSAPAPVQKQRVMARPGMSEEKFAAILAAQMPDAQKRALADYVVDTGTSLEKTRAALAKVMQEIAAKA